MKRRELLKSAGAIIASTTLPSLGLSKSHHESLKEYPLSTIAFGSCNRQWLPQDHWSVISEDNPDAWLWLGDNIYGDGYSLEERAKAWSELKFNPGYHKLSQETFITGTWDDHDFAQDNAGGEFADKQVSQELFAQFLDVGPQHEIRTREGIYHAYELGPDGQKCLVVMLDLRYFKESPMFSGQLLGESQWLWLEELLSNADAQLIILGSSLNVHSNITGFGLEGWNEYPDERHRLYELLGNVEAPTLILSGDRHMAEITRRDIGHGKIIYEFMSSGMTHSVPLPLPSFYRVGKQIRQKNYGLIHVDWTTDVPSLVLEIKSPQTGEVLESVQVNY